MLAGGAQAAEKAMREMEVACKDVQTASNELETASVMMQGELPPTLEAVEDASREFEEVGEAMRAILGPFSGGPAKGNAKKGIQRRNQAARKLLEQHVGQSSNLQSFDDDDTEARLAAKEMTDHLATAVRTP
jgi:hypothetical protein